MEVEIQSNPYKDYSNLICNLNNNNSDYFNKDIIEYNTIDDSRSQISNISRFSRYR